MARDEQIADIRQALARNSGGNYENGVDVARNVKLLLGQNPFLAEDPQTLMEFARMPLTPGQMLAQSGQMFGMQATDKMYGRLQRLPEQTQRSLWDTLPLSQQMSLKSMGYQPPQIDQEGRLGRFFGPLDEIAGAVLGPVAGGVRTVGEPILDGLQWASDRVSQLYRTIRVMDDGSQLAALGGAIVGGAAVFAAPFTFGGSLAVAGGLLGGALLGGTTAAIISNPNDWHRAWKDTYVGERTFDRPSQRRVESLLGDPRLVGAAQDLADLEGFDMRDFIYEIASLRNVDINSQVRALEAYTEKFAAKGTPEFAQANVALLTTLRDPSFQEAVAILQDGKISPGRDLADLLVGSAISWNPIDQGNGSALHTFISGIADAAWQVSVDPTLVLGKATKFREARRFGVDFLNAPDAAAEFKRVASLPEVQRYHERFVEAYNARDVRRMRTETREMVRVFKPFDEYMAAKRTQAGVATGDATREDLVEFFRSSKGLEQLMKGVGSMRGRPGFIMAHAKPTSDVYRKLAGEMRGFVNGLVDPQLERKLAEVISEATAKGEDWLDAARKSDVWVFANYLEDIVVDETTGKLVVKNGPEAKGLEAVGRALGELPVFHSLGNVLSSITTMVPRGKAIDLMGDRMVDDIYQLSELARYMGMPSWARKAWAETIISAPNVGDRMVAAHGWLNNALTMAGGRLTKHAEEFVDTYLDRMLQSYGVGDEKIVNGRKVNLGIFVNDQADMIVMPDLQELTRAVQLSWRAQVLGIVDQPILNAYTDRIWKPSVLLRIGFIPRAAGEEQLNFMFRGGFGGLVQEFAARNIGREQLYQEAVAKLRAGKELTPVERNLALMGEVAVLPAHIRPVARMLNYFDWTQPAFKKLQKYGDFYRGMLEDGLPFINNSRFAEARVTQALERMAGLPPSVSLGDAPLAPRIATGNSLQDFVANTYKDARINVARRTEALLLGNPYSWRRLATGGVNDVLLQGAAQMQEAWAVHLFQEVSSTTAGPFDRGFDPARAETRIETGWRGRKYTVYSMPVKGQTSRYMRGQGFYDKGFHYQTRYVVEDPVVDKLVRKYVSRLRGGVSVDDETIERLVTLQRRLQTPDGRLLASDFAGTAEVDNLRATVDLMATGYRPDILEPSDLPQSRDLAAGLRTFLNGKADTTADQLFDELRLMVARRMTAAKGFQYGGSLSQDLDVIAEMRSLVSGMSANDRAWVAQMLRLGTASKMQATEAVLAPLTRSAETRLSLLREAFEDASSRQVTIEEALDVYRQQRDAVARELNDLAQLSRADDNVLVAQLNDVELEQLAAQAANDTEVFRRLVDEYDNANLFEAEVETIRNVSSSEVVAFKQQLVAEQEALFESVQDRLLRHGPGVAQVDVRGNVTFWLSPQQAGEWDWFRQLTPKRQKAIRNQYLRPGTSRGEPLDVLATELGMTIDEWADTFLSLLDEFETVRKSRGATRKLSNRQTKQRYVSDRLAEIERFASPFEAGQYETVFRRINNLTSTTDVNAEVLQQVGSLLETISAARSPRSLAALEQLSMFNNNLEMSAAVREIAAEHVDRLTRDLADWDQMIDGAAAQLVDVDVMGAFAPALELAQRQLTSLQSSDPRWYSSWADIEESMIETAANELLSVMRQDAASRSQRLAQAYPSFEDGTVLAWEMPSRSLAPTATFEDILIGSQNREVLLANQEMIERWLSANLDGNGFDVGASRALVANKELADELFKFFRPAVSAPQQTARAMRLPAEIRHGRKLKQGGEGEQPPIVAIESLFKRQVAAGKSETDLWRVDAEIYDDFIPVDADDVDGLKARSRAMAEMMVGRMRQTMTKYNDFKLRANVREVDATVGQTEWDNAQAVVVDLERQIAAVDPSDQKTLNGLTAQLRDAQQVIRQMGRRPLGYEPLVHRQRPDGSLQGVGPDERLSMRDTFVDAKNQRIEPGSQQYFSDAPVEFSDGSEVMWALVGPMLEDIQDAVVGLQRTAPTPNLSLRPGQTMASTDRHRVYRSRVEHVQNVGEGAPDFIIAPTMTDVRNTTWDRVVRFGFDRIIGPAIDALARQPMAFHFFAERYAMSRAISNSLRDPELVKSLSEVAFRANQAGQFGIDVPGMAARIKRVAAFHDNNPAASRWSTHQTLAWLRGHSDAELADIFAGVQHRTRFATQPEARAASADAFALSNQAPGLLKEMTSFDGSGDDFLTEVRELLAGNIVDRDGNPIWTDQLGLIGRHPVLSKLTESDWNIVVAAERNYQYAHKAAGEYAAIHAINDMIPFIDSHEFRSQFAEHGKGLLPFWYAEENFLKRWARTAIDQGPLSTIRKAQLAYGGLKSGGVIRTDEQGRDYFVYPGSGLLIEAVSKVWPGAGELPIGVMFQAPTDRMLPGLTAERVGQPSPSPFVSLSLRLLQTRVPEMEELNRVFLGDVGTAGSAFSAFYPTQIRNFVDAIAKDENSSQRFASAMLSAISMLEAKGQGLPPNATEGDIDEFLRKVSNHARIIVVAQATAGFFAPGAPQQLVTGDDNITGIGVRDLRNEFSELYLSFVSNLGIEEGTLQFLETYPMANAHHILAAPTDGSHPALALIEGMTESRSGAPLPATTTATTFYDQNENYMKDVPFAGPWLLPAQGEEERSQYAYDQQTINDLRLRQTPRDFVTSIKFREGAGPYFAMRQSMLDGVSKAEAAGDERRAAQLKEDFDVWAALWKANHPVFTKELMSSDGRERRNNVITEMRRVVNDPAAPASPHLETLQNLIASYDNYKVNLAILSDDRSMAGQARTELLKKRFDEFMNRAARTNPTTFAFWTSVLRPESNLD